MFHGIERELLNGEPGFSEHQFQLSYHPELSDKQENEIRDIWELPPQESTRRERVSKQEFKLFRIFSQLKRFSLKA
ncbi:MAG: hypothetical protein RMX65_020545 [Nostoc sp. DedQUE01]|nr:hypothetical protein [Nostoc sp. DedQUE11]MDZ8075267.1 hypothetical protein [Nostoc sp. DedQUE01]